MDDSAVGLIGAMGAVHAEEKADPNLARNLAATCANCHGTDGKAVAGSERGPGGTDKASSSCRN